MAFRGLADALGSGQHVNAEQQLHHPQYEYHAEQGEHAARHDEDGHRLDVAVQQLRRPLGQARGRLGYTAHDGGDQRHVLLGLGERRGLLVEFLCRRQGGLEARRIAVVDGVGDQQARRDGDHYRQREQRDALGERAAFFPEQEAEQPEPAGYGHEQLEHGRAEKGQQRLLGIQHAEDEQEIAGQVGQLLGYRGGGVAGYRRHSRRRDRRRRGELHHRVGLVIYRRDQIFRERRVVAQLGHYEV